MIPFHIRTIFLVSWKPAALSAEYERTGQLLLPKVTSVVCLPQGLGWDELWCPNPHCIDGTELRAALLDQYFLHGQQ